MSRNFPFLPGDEFFDIRLFMEISDCPWYFCGVHGNVFFFIYDFGGLFSFFCSFASLVKDLSVLFNLLMDQVPFY